MPDDPDRDAILARRKRLVALALSGLIGPLAGCDEVRPGPCLQPPYVEGDQPPGPTPTPTPDPYPGPCLEAPYDPPEPPAPQVCLSRIAPEEPPNEPPEPEGPTVPEEG